MIVPAICIYVNFSKRNRKRPRAKNIQWAKNERTRRNEMFKFHMIIMVRAPFIHITISSQYRLLIRCDTIETYHKAKTYTKANWFECSMLPCIYHSRIPSSQLTHNTAAWSHFSSALVGSLYFSNRIQFWKLFHNKVLIAFNANKFCTTRLFIWWIFRAPIYQCEWSRKVFYQFSYWRIATAVKC